MKALILVLALTFSSLHACVTYNPSTHTYIVDNYGLVDINGRKHKTPKPIIDSAASRDRSKEKCKEKKEKK
jgi:hypothetical protein